MIANPLKVRELMDQIVGGQVVLPEIQRAYVWKGPQVAKLMDSLYRDYPTGQILLWDTDALPVTKNLAGVRPPALPAVGAPKIVLDGQQRLTSLFKALTADEDPIRVFFNVETEQFQLYLNRLKSDAHWIDVRAVVNNTTHELDVLDKISSAGGAASKQLAKTYLDRLQRLRRIGEYKFPIEVFRTDDYEEVTELFVRINSAGTRLRGAELVLAQLALRLPGAIVDKFEDALEDYSEVGFELDTRFLTRALIAIGTGQSRFRYLTEFWKKSATDLEKDWTRTRKGVDAAVNFVRNNALFDSADWLPSLNAMIPLAAFFETNRQVGSNMESELLRWFYLASLRGRYTGSGETAMDEDLKAVRESEPILALLKNAVPPSSTEEVTPDEFDDAGWRNPLFALTYAAARKKGAKDWFTGVSLSKHAVGADHQIEVHHIFPKAVLRHEGVSRHDRDEIANLAFLTAKPNKSISSTAPEKYLPKIAKDRLRAQWVPMDEDLWKLDRFQDFLAERRKLLATAVNELIQGSAAAGF
jgi:hypothetical protein